MISEKTNAEIAQGLKAYLSPSKDIALLREYWGSFGIALLEQAIIRLEQNTEAARPLAQEEAA